MPPKPRGSRRASASTTKNTVSPAIASDHEKDDGNAKQDATMPPPPVPLPPPLILEPEMNALSSCLKDAMVKTGQIYRFYKDTQSLGIQKYAPHPPRSLTSSLGREVEKYDQLCDTIDAHILRAIAVLQRDVTSEEQRIKNALTASVSTRTRSKSSSVSPTSTRIALPPLSGSSASGPETSPEISSAQQPLGRTQTSPPISSGGPGGRRQSTISISSLHRPGPLPLKLDLSSTVRFTPEDFSIINTGLASPVTLAPKSARPSTATDYPPDMMAAFDASNRQVDIDLTVGDTEPSSNANMSLDPAIGNSADKPIELDIEGMDIDMANMADMTDLFGPSGDPSSTTDGLFTPSTSTPDLARIKDEEHLEREILQVFEGNEDLFASLDGHGQSSHSVEPSNSQSLNIPSTSDAAVSSPGSILATFATTSSYPTDQQANSISNDASFELDPIDFDQIPGLFTNEPEMNLTEMEALLNLGGGGETKSGS